MTAPKALPGLPSVAALTLTLAFLFLATPTYVLGQPGSPEEIVNPTYFQGMAFRMVGPTRGGRSTTVAGHPDHPLTFYAGFTGGGVWKTTDAGIHWRPISDGYFETGSTGAIRVAPSDSRIVYVGTGSDGIRSNVIDGRGVYRSTDAGETWEHLGLRDVGQIGAVEVHPTNPDVVYVAAMGKAFAPTPDRGVYKSTNGGRTWDRVLFTSDSVGAVDLELNPANPDEIYVAMYRGERRPWTIISGMEASGEEDGIWKSNDGGVTWRYLTRGLPSGLVGKIDLAVTPADPARVYAVVETVEEEEGLYRSDDRGESWTLVSTQAGLMNRPFYYTNVDADPTNADVVYVNNEGFYKSTNGGRSFSRLSTPHGDNHDMWINPDNPEIFIQSNDGGVNVTLNGGQSWSTQNNQPTAELYQVDLSLLDLRRPAGQQHHHGALQPSGGRLGARASGELEGDRGLRDGSGRAQARESQHRVLQLQRAFRALQPAHRTGTAVLRVGRESLRPQPQGPSLPVPAGRTHRNLPSQPRRGLPRIPIRPQDGGRGDHLGDHLPGPHGLSTGAPGRLGGAHHEGHHR